ncbi:DNA polymerase IV [Lysinibacillus sp. KU-BSD001]|uniref:DNA polymerase IV n=1 Tax=Lysinibacillus sp. KU-BSD001 TaxID=3141328 RepID=UPI0036EB82AB
MANRGRVILHVDMNSFYASVEQVYDPTLKGKPIAIAGNPKERRGIVITCSYEAREKGVYTTQRVSEALKVCPELILIPPHFERYRDASKKFYTLLTEYTPLVEPVSIDESYVDISFIESNKHPMAIVQDIQNRILNELQLPCSIGVAPNKFLAKMASDMKKPLGITIIRKRDVEEVLWPLDVIHMHGVGKKTADKLKDMNIHTIGDLAKAEKTLVQQKLGMNGLRLLEKANGVDHRSVDPESIYDTKSVGNSTTLPYDVSNLAEIQDILYTLAEKVSNRLKAKGLVGTTISIQIKYSDWKNQTNSRTIQNSTDEVSPIFEVAKNLIADHWKEKPVRLLGVTVGNVMDKTESTEQLSIFNFEEYVKDEPILNLMNKLERQFGEGVIKRGVKGKRVGKYQANTSFSKDFLDDFK